MAMVLIVVLLQVLGVEERATTSTVRDWLLAARNMASMHLVPMVGIVERAIMPGTCTNTSI
jgi:hypothetical protein